MKTTSPNDCQRPVRERPAGRWAWLSIIVAQAVLVGSAWGQTQGGFRSASPKQKSVTAFETLHSGNASLFETRYASSATLNPLSESRKKLRELRAQLTKATTDEDKDAAKKAIREALVEYFDRDAERRKEALRRLNLRTEAMAKLLDRRTATRNELVALQLKSFTYDADGLGLFSKPKPKPNAAHIYVNVAYASQQKPDPLKDAMKRVNEARKTLKAAKANEDRAQAIESLREALGAYFDDDMKLRQKELTKIRTDLESMKTALDKRIAAKGDIVDLQFQMIVNQSEGLGFFRETGSNANNQRGLFPNFGN